MTMNNTIAAFLEQNEIAVAGVSIKENSWGRDLMKELKKGGYTVFPINPKYEEVEGEKCLNTANDLPESVENLILAVNPESTVEIIRNLGNSNIKRVWMNQGIGAGAFSPLGLDLLKEQKREFVYGFCPMMFFGSGIHKFHFWMRKNMGKTPTEFTKKVSITAMAD